MALQDPAFDPVPPPPEPAPPPQRPPERWWGNHFAEVRWQLELSRLLVDPVYHGSGVPHGDGAPVMAVPGFLAGDASLQVLRGWLRRVGYEAHASGIGLNGAGAARAVGALERRLERMPAPAGRRAALIGHGGGGHFVKALARRRPDLVSSVVSLGAGLD